MKLTHLLPLLALPLLAACQPEMETTVYLSDVQSALNTGTTMSVPVTLRIPQSGEDDCKKALPTLIEKLKSLAPVTGKGQCISKDQHGNGTQLAEIETELQLVPAGTDPTGTNLFVLAADKADDGGTALTLKMLKPIADVITALEVDTSMGIDFDPASFILHLNNDTAGTVTIGANGVFINGAPVLPETGGTVEIARRQIADIVFSDVAASWVEQGNGYGFAVVTPKP